MLDGVIHNRAALCRELGLPVDTPMHDVLRCGWQRWSAQLLPRLDGSFALALCEPDRISLFRDASGLKSLFWHVDASGMLHFGSDLSVLVRSPGVPRHLARFALHEFLRFGDIAAPRTIYADILAVESGELVCVSGRGTVTRRVLDRLSEVTPPPANLEQALDTLEVLLTRSIERRLDGASRPAAFLSGGIDSSLLNALASQEWRDLTAVTVGFEDSPLDEFPAAARIAAQLGLRHEVLRFSQAECVHAVERLAAAAEQPIADPATPATLLAFDHCRERYDAVLDGTGADEAVGLMPPRHVRFAVAHASRIPHPLRRGLTQALNAVPALAPWTALTDFEHPADTMIRWKGFQRSEIELLCGEAVSFEQTRFYREFARHGRHQHFERFSALLDAMPSERLNQAMRAAGLASISYPFCAPEVDTFLRKLGVEHRWQPGEPKRILRRLLGRHLPAALWDTPKHGFDFPLIAFLTASNHAVVRRFLAPSMLARAGAIDPDLAARYASRFMAGETALAFRVWTLIVFAAWLERHDDFQS